MILQNIYDISLLFCKEVLVFLGLVARRLEYGTVACLQIHLAKAKLDQM
jgi:hypothetical protein